MSDTKKCKRCKAAFQRTGKQSATTWSKRRFCSVGCSNKHRGALAHKRLVEDVAWIVDHDHPDSVAKRVGYGTAKDLLSKLRDTGASELADKLARSVDRYKRGELHYRDPKEFA